MIFKHNGKVNLSARGAETAKGNKTSFLGKLLGSSKDENSNGEAAGTANVMTVFSYEISAEISTDELQQIYSNNRDNMNNVVEDVQKIMKAVRVAYDSGKEIALDLIDETHKNDLADYKRSVESKKARLEAEAEKDKLEEKFHPGVESEIKTETKSE